VDQASIKIGGRFGKKILDLPRQVETMVGVDEGGLKLTHETKGKARKAGRGGLLARVPEPPHLLHAPSQQPTRLGIV
jgi:hypothetical protein